MTRIPKLINGVIVEFGPEVYPNNVHDRLVEGLEFCISPEIAKGYNLQKIWISNAKEFGSQSRHSMGKAVDISRLNGIFLAHGYNNSGAITALVKAIQSRFEEYDYRRENFGPSACLRLGKPQDLIGYSDHIHLSVT